MTNLGSKFIVVIMTNYIEEYLNTRRARWPYDGRYVVKSFGQNGFVAMIDENVAGMVWADVTDGEAVMHMKLKLEYKEYGIGTELLHKLMDHLVESGCKVVRYSISVEHWAYQIYENLGFKIESRDTETINFVRYVKA